MQVKRDRYDSYHGRNRFATAFKVLIAVLALILLAALAALFFLEPYIVYSSDGVRIELPFFRDQEPPEVSSGAVVVATPQASATPAPAAEEPFRAVLLDRTALYDGTAAAQAEAAGANAAIFDMKADDGSLGYRSELELALEAEVNAADPAINAAIRLLNGGELYTVARVSCFRDNTIPSWHNSLALRTSSGNWRDGTDSRWLSAASAEARGYVAGVCRELAELGFDEILLDCCGFPTQGELDRLQAGENYDPEDLTGPVEAFLDELDAALADHPETRLSVMTSRTVLTGGSDGSGQTLALLEEHQLRPLVQEDGAPLPELDWTQAVPVTAEPADPGSSWAVLTANTQ